MTRRRRRPRLRLLATEGACPLEGGLPLIEAGQRIGVSGMQSTQDARAAAAGVAAMTTTLDGV